MLLVPTLVLQTPDIGLSTMDMKLDESFLRNHGDQPGIGMSIKGAIRPR